MIEKTRRIVTGFDANGKSNRAWVNRGSKPVLLVAVLIDAKPLPPKSDNRGR
jgi:hypothetical protein